MESDYDDMDVNIYIRLPYAHADMSTHTYVSIHTPHTHPHTPKKASNIEKEEVIPRKRRRERG